MCMLVYICIHVLFMTNPDPLPDFLIVYNRLGEILSVQPSYSSVWVSAAVPSLTISVLLLMVTLFAQGTAAHLYTTESILLLCRLVNFVYGDDSIVTIVELCRWNLFLNG